MGGGQVGGREGRAGVTSTGNEPAPTAAAVAVGDGVAAAGAGAIVAVIVARTGAVGAGSSRRQAVQISKTSNSQKVRFIMGRSSSGPGHRTCPVLRGQGISLGADLLPHLAGAQVAILEVDATIAAGDAGFVGRVLKRVPAQRDHF